MSEQYEGDPVFPEDFTLPDDSGPATAMQHNVAHEALGDRTRYLKVHLDAVETHVRLLGVLNFPVKGDPNAAGSARWGAFRRAVSTRDEEWWVFGTSKNVERTRDGGHTYTGSSLIGGGVGTGTEDICRADVDSSGNVVAAIAATSDLFTYAASTDTWAKVTSIPDVVAATFPHVVYDPVHARWCWAAITAAGAFHVYTSTDRASWAVATSPPAAGIFAATRIVMDVNKTSGRILLIAVTANEELYIRKSDDGGVTWSAIGSSWTTSIVAPDHLVIGSADDGTFIFSFAADGDGETWRSTDDGETWLVEFLIEATISTPACINVGALAGVAHSGRLWCAIAQEGEPPNATNRIVYSLDDGATWKRSPIRPSGTYAGVFAGAGGFLVLTGTDAYMGMRVGAPDLGVL
jgi:hypothetical protein